MTADLAHPAYGVPRAAGGPATVVLENNPSSMTLEGTNSWVLRAPGSPTSVVVDPGHDDEPHLAALADAAGAVELVLLTHHHGDHADGAPRFATQVGAPVRAYAARLCVDGEPLADGERLEAAGLHIDVRHTPGHTDDSVCLSVEHAGEHVVLTGDTILGYGTTVLDDLGDYLRSLQQLTELPSGVLGLPGHGPELPDLARTVREYLAHRQDRLEQIRGALRALGPDAGARDIVEFVYADVDPGLWPAAEVSVRAQLDFLRSVG